MDSLLDLDMLVEVEKPLIQKAEDAIAKLNENQYLYKFNPTLYNQCVDDIRAASHLGWRYKTHSNWLQKISMEVENK